MPDKKDILCNGCRKKIAAGSMQEGELSIKCKCGVINVISAISKEKIQIAGSKTSDLILGTFTMERLYT